MPFHVGFDYTINNVGQTGRSLVYSIQRNALPAGNSAPAPSPPYMYDFSTNLFTQTPVQSTAALTAGSGPMSLWFYSAVISSTPTNQWFDGEYQVTITDQGAPLANSPLPRVLYSEMVGGDDGFTNYYTSTAIGPQPNAATFLDRILKDIRQLAIDAGLFNSQTAVFSLIDASNFPIAGGPMLILAPTAFSPNERDVIGAGRFLTTMNGAFNARIRNELLLDVGEQDYYRLIDLRYSLLRLAERLIGLYQMYLPIDAAGNVLTREPIRMAGKARPNRDPRDPEQWAEIGMTFELAYKLSMAPG